MVHKGWTRIMFCNVLGKRLGNDTLIKVLQAYHSWGSEDYHLCQILFRKLFEWDNALVINLMIADFNKYYGKNW